MKIIAFGHRRFVGKDTAANFAVTHVRTTNRGILVTKTGFASKLKAQCYELYSWAGLQDEAYYEAHSELKDVILPKIGKSPRTIWIEYGTSVGRAIYDKTWIMYPLSKKCDYLFIKDLRFHNEVEEILSRGGIVIRIDNPRVQKFDDKADSNLADFNGWTEIINNDGSLADFNKKVISTIQWYI
jgi:hypothetical protein